jgi:hypothetical protein
MSATWDRFHGAALLLAGAAPVKQRLVSAYKEHLSGIDVEDLPRELRAEFVALTAALTAGRAVGGMGVLEATVRKMSDGQAASYAGRFIALYGLVAQAQGRAQRGPTLRAISSSQS